MTQKVMFDGSDLMARARHTDPPTSHEAAEQVEASGRAGSQRRQLLEAVRAMPGSTAGELQAFVMGQAGRVAFAQMRTNGRLAELRKLGLVVNGPARECKVMGTKQMTWSKT